MIPDSSFQKPSSIPDFSFAISDPLGWWELTAKLMELVNDPRLQSSDLKLMDLVDDPQLVFNFWHEPEIFIWK